VQTAEVGHLPRNERGTFVAHHQRSQEGRAHQMGRSTKHSDVAIKSSNIYSEKLCNDLNLTALVIPGKCLLSSLVHFLFDLKNNKEGSILYAMAQEVNCGILFS
jgi:hypothetical protein